MGSKMQEDQQRLKSVLVNTVTLLCQQGLSYTSLRVQGLLGVTVNDQDVFVVHLDKTLQECNDKGHTTSSDHDDYPEASSFQINTGSEQHTDKGDTSSDGQEASSFEACCVPELHTTHRDASTGRRKRPSEDQPEGHSPKLARVEEIVSSDVSNNVEVIMIKPEPRDETDSIPHQVATSLYDPQHPGIRVSNVVSLGGATSEYSGRFSTQDTNTTYVTTSSVPHCPTSALLPPVNVPCAPSWLQGNNQLSNACQPQPCPDLGLDTTPESKFVDTAAHLLPGADDIDTTSANPSSSTTTQPVIPDPVFITGLVCNPQTATTPGAWVAPPGGDLTEDPPTGTIKSKRAYKLRGKRRKTWRAANQEPEEQCAVAEDENYYVDQTGKFKIIRMVKSTTYGSRMKKNPRTRNARHACLFCRVDDRPQSNLAKHLKTHKEIPEMIQIMDMEKQAKTGDKNTAEALSREISLRLDAIRQKGNDRHNKAVIRSGEGVLHIARRHESLHGFDIRDLVSCEFCHLWLHTTTNLNEHVKQCKVRISLMAHGTECTKM